MKVRPRLLSAAPLAVAFAIGLAACASGRGIAQSSSVGVRPDADGGRLRDAPARGAGGETDGERDGERSGGQQAGTDLHQAASFRLACSDMSIPKPANRVTIEVPP